MSRPSFQPSVRPIHRFHLSRPSIHLSRSSCRPFHCRFRLTSRCGFRWMNHHFHLSNHHFHLTTRRCFRCGYRQTIHRIRSIRRMIHRGFRIWVSC